MTDNRNRTVAEIRHAFSKAGGNLGTSGSVAYMFAKQGIISYPAGTDEDVVMEAALEAGAEDVVVNDDDSIDVLTTPEEFISVKDRLNQAIGKPEHAEVTMRAENLNVLGQGEAEKMLRLQDILEELDDVQDVYSNADIPEAVLSKLEV